MIHPNGDCTNPAGIRRAQTTRRSTRRADRALSGAREAAAAGRGRGRARPGEARAMARASWGVENCLRQVFEGPVKEPYPRPTLFVRTEHREKTISPRPNRRAQINQTDREGSTEEALAGPRPRGPRGLALRGRFRHGLFYPPGNKFQNINRREN